MHIFVYLSCSLVSRSTWPEGLDTRQPFQSLYPLLMPLLWQVVMLDRELPLIPGGTLREKKGFCRCRRQQWPMLGTWIVDDIIDKDNAAMDKDGGSTHKHFSAPRHVSVVMGLLLMISLAVSTNLVLPCSWMLWWGRWVLSIHTIDMIKLLNDRHNHNVKLLWLKTIIAL